MFRLDVKPVLDRQSSEMSLARIMGTEIRPFSRQLPNDLHANTSNRLDFYASDIWDISKGCSELERDPVRLKRIQHWRGNWRIRPG